VTVAGLPSLREHTGNDAATAMKQEIQLMHTERALETAKTKTVAVGASDSAAKRANRAKAANGEAGGCVRSLAIGAAIMWILAAEPAQALDAELARGQYLVTIGSCNDCHTPGAMLGKPNTAKLLSGSDVGLDVPGLGIFVGRNLTPDKETGLGTWTRAQIVTAITTGERPDGRILAPIMPWRFYSQLTQQDADAIAAYLQSLPPVRNAVPGPFGPSEKVPVFVMEVLPPDVHNNLLPLPVAHAQPPAN
jgi:mono/diheme cytochrome c family protein